MRVTKLPPVTKRDNTKETRDRRQHNRMFQRSWQGGLPKQIISEYKRFNKLK